VLKSVLIEGAGILGRWRDGTEPANVGVTGPFWLWPRRPDAECSPMATDDGSSWETTSSSETEVHTT